MLLGGFGRHLDLSNADHSHLLKAEETPWDYCRMLMMHIKFKWSIMKIFC